MASKGSSVFELLDLPMVIEEYLDAHDDARPELDLARELQRRCAQPCLYLLPGRAVLTTPLGVRVYARPESAAFAAV